MLNDITFPQAVSATAVLVGFNAALATGLTKWPEKQQAYIVEEVVPTVSLVDPAPSEPIGEGFSHEIASIFATLAAGQEPLGTEFEMVWDDNVDILYES